MRNNKLFLLFSLIFLLLICVSAVSANEDIVSNSSVFAGDTVDSVVLEGISDDLVCENIADSNCELNDGENNCSVIPDSYSSLKKNSLRDSIDGENQSSNASNDDLKSELISSDVDSNDGLVSNDTFDDFNVDSNGLVSNDTFDDNYTFLVNSDNFNIFFDEFNVLRSDYGGCVLVFDGCFDNLGVICIDLNNTKVLGRNSLFNNTVFALNASNLLLSNVNMVLDKEFPENEHSAIFVHGDNVTVYNCTIDYDAPYNCTVFGIYSNGHHNDFVNLSLINNTINFRAHPLGMYDYAYPVFLRNTHDSLVYGNVIDCELPIKFIMYGFSGEYGSVSMDTVAALAADYCENLTLSNNYIHSSVNGGSKNYPTLDTVILYGCSYSLFENNTILCEDFYTQRGEDNYLQAVDLYRLSDVTFINNNISVVTNGGKSGMGTAYCIVVNGPVSNVKIAFNNLTTYNNGPNCGIYSQNYYGDTSIDIISNFINVTGNASNDGTNPSWCLVTGIEVQDSNDLILNNTIIVNNLGDYKSNANVYGISYIQNTGGGHSYNIQFNNITTNGNYGVKLIGDVKNSTTVNSTISNNVLNTTTTSNKTGASTNGQIDKPSGTVAKNNTNGKFKNNMSEDYYSDWLKDYLNSDNDRVKTDFSWITNAINTASNGTGFSNSTGNGTGFIDNGGDDVVGNGSSGSDSIVNGTEDGNGTGNGTVGGNITDVTNATNATNGTAEGGIDNATDTNSTNPEVDVPIDPKDPDPADNNTTEDVNVTEPVNPTVPANSENATVPVNETDPVNNTEPIDNTVPDNSTEPVNNTDVDNVTNPIVDDNSTETNNDTNQTVPMENDEPKEEPDEKTDEGDSSDKDEEKDADDNSSPGESSEELSDSTESQDSENQESENSDMSVNVNPGVSKESSLASTSSSSPGLSGASAAHNAYELDEKTDEIVVKSVNYGSLAVICIFALALIIIGYKRQKDIEEEE
ncbi:hypothetical protein [uncultured Methanobrevibacter sp.]|uniref:hypothetical protein n=1 Tax=uncultured Methanobrevibacter sp. TaxID=253161 RepID=UPI00261F5A24